MDPRSLVLDCFFKPGLFSFMMDYAGRDYGMKNMSFPCHIFRKETSNTALTDCPVDGAWQTQLSAQAQAHSRPVFQDMKKYGSSTFNVD